MVTTPDQRRFFRDNGYIIFPEMFSRHEVGVIMNDLKNLDTEHLVVDAAGRNKDGMAVEDGETPRLQFGLHETDSCFEPLCSHPRLAGVMQELMGVPLYIYHSKLAFKAPFVGSVQYWHQDFGYWRRNHSKPTMGSCLLMLDEHTEDNACMQVLSGSHRGGVVEHRYRPRESTGEKQLAIPAEEMTIHFRRYNRVKFVGSPGTVAAWHSNIMHASSHNISENPRRALIVAFNAMGNSDEREVNDSPFTAHGVQALELSADDCLL
ncbi:MAG: phytanoyl-CoA dioxygenase family protein [Candidatus Poribacteria bacterium]|nr:phytanoyl-CoA dioxygenase family protein [Candidatus Poribacteria bacterium]